MLCTVAMATPKKAAKGDRNEYFRERMLLIRLAENKKTKKEALLNERQTFIKAADVAQNVAWCYDNCELIKPVV